MKKMNMMAFNDAMDRTWWGKATGLAMLGRFQEAMECYDRALRLNPGNLAARKAREATARMAHQDA